MFLFLCAEKAEIMLEKHRDQQSKERVKLAKHRKKCMTNPEKCMGVVIDGMDKKNEIASLAMSTKIY